MVRKLRIHNFKAFEHFELDFDDINILVGPNNAGKTSVFHALQLFFYCVEKVVARAHNTVSLKKTQTADIAGVPYISVRDIFHKQKVRSGRGPVRLVIAVKVDSVPEVTIELYQAFSTNFMINGRNLELTARQYEELLKYKPVLIPSTTGVTPEEDLYRLIAQEEYISEGRHNEIIRNMIYRISKQENWSDFKELLAKLFKLVDFGVPFNEETDLWITANYQESDVELDVIAAGSGFLQALNILCFLFLYSNRKLALIDEPDAHMHQDLQRVLFQTLSEVSRKNGIQLLISTHSQIFINEAALEDIQLIDKEQTAAIRVSNYRDLVPFFSDNGLSLPAPKIIEIIKNRRVVFVEGKEADYENFYKALGRRIIPDFDIATRHIIPIPTGGETKTWPFDAIRLFKSVIDSEIRYVYIADRDLYTDEQIEARKSRAESEKENIQYPQFRNRECYLVQPHWISRVVAAKWKRSHPKAKIPSDLTPKAIEETIFAYCKAEEIETKAVFTQFQNHFARDKDPSKEKQNFVDLETYFQRNYRDPLDSGAIPFRLVDGKAVLRYLRTKFAENHGISFSDREIIDAIDTSDVPKDLREILMQIANLAN